MAADTTAVMPVSVVMVIFRVAVMPVTVIMGNDTPVFMRMFPDGEASLYRTNRSNHRGNRNGACLGGSCVGWSRCGIGGRRGCIS